MDDGRCRSFLNYIFEFEKATAMADSCFDSEESESGEDREHSLSRREIDELIDAVIKPPTASRKVRVK